MPRKKKAKSKIKEVSQSSDLFKSMTDIIGRDLTEDEVRTITEAARVFIRENFTPVQIFEEDVLREDVLLHGIVGEEDEGTDYGDDHSFSMSSEDLFGYDRDQY